MNEKRAPKSRKLGRFGYCQTHEKGLYEGRIGTAPSVRFGGLSAHPDCTPHPAASKGCAMPRRTFEERFWAKVDKSGDCWIWTASRNDRGYGKLQGPAGRLVYAHRASAQLAGMVVADDVQVCHRCDNPPCVNPAHLFVGSVGDNHDDMVRKGRSTLGERNPQAKLTAEDVLVIRARVAGGEYQRVVGADYGVDQAHVSLICRRGVWRHLP